LTIASPIAMPTAPLASLSRMIRLPTLPSARPDGALMFSSTSSADSTVVSSVTETGTTRVVWPGSKKMRSDRVR
jgi:hypothetical protein